MGGGDSAGEGEEEGKGRENLETCGKREEPLRVIPENIVLPGMTTSFPPGPPRELIGFPHRKWQL